MSESEIRPSLIVSARPGPLRARLSYGIRTPEAKEPLFSCTEPQLGFWVRLFRWTDLRRRTPMRMELRDAQDRLQLRMERGWGFFGAPVKILNPEGDELARLKRRKPRIGGQLDLLDPKGERIGTFRGKWHNMEFEFYRNDQVMARISRKWSGITRELLGSGAYALGWKEGDESVSRETLLAAVICIDRMFGI